MTSSRKRLVLIDSHALIHRAYHALPDFSSSKGEPTGALYGLASMLLKLPEELKPDYIIAARDLPGKTHRHEVYEDYKGTRAEADQELIVQLQKAPEVFTAFGIPVLSAAGFEADDVIGTLVKKAESRDDIEVVIATGDMDTLQLVNDAVSVFTLKKGINDTILYDSDRVHERYGFGPEHIVDYKALRGDPSDNIKGVKGIGEKTASELIEKFGSIEDIYEALEKHEAAFAQEVKPRVFELLKGGKDDAFFSKQLATIHTNAPVEFELPDHPWSLADHIGGIEKMCDELEFKSLKDRARAILKRGDAKAEKPKKGSAPPDNHALFEVAQVQVDGKQLEETALALWLLKSDYTVPGLEEIAQYTGTEEFARSRERIFADLKKTGRLQEVYDRIEHPLLPVVKKMNATGIAVNTVYLEALASEYRKELEKIAASVYRHAGHEFNINSPKQLGEVLYDELKISAKQKKTATGARTTREDELLKLADEHPIVMGVLNFRELSKLLGTYVEKLPALVSEDGRLRATFLQTGTVTGRMGCENPNLQNIPTKTEYGRRIRGAFVAPKGKVLVSIDYSQIELRIAAGLSGDEKLCEAFKSGSDIHAAVASQVFGVPVEKVDKEMRRKAKVINFGILYGMGVNALRENLGAATTSREEASQYLDDYFTRFSGLAQYVESVKAEATKIGYTETLFGRRRYLPGLKSKLPMMRSQAERMAVNAPIQGTQSDIIKLAMVEVDAKIRAQKRDDKVKLLMQVHDELVYEIDEDIAEQAARDIRTIMERVAPIEKLHSVPIKAEIALGKDWGDMRHLS